MLGQPGLRAQGRQRAHRLADGREIRAELIGTGGVLAHGRGEPVQLVDDMELGFALAPAGEAAHGVVARTDMGIDVGERLLRLDDRDRASP